MVCTKKYERITPTLCCYINNLANDLSPSPFSPLVVITVQRISLQVTQARGNHRTGCLLGPAWFTFTICHFGLLEPSAID